MQIASAIKTDLLETTSDVKRSAPYESPVNRTRENKKSTTIDINEFARRSIAASSCQCRSESGVVLHSSSKWGTAWKNFRENNAVANSLHCCCHAPCHAEPEWFEMKMKFDESDNLLIRATRSVTDTVMTNVGAAAILL